MTLLFFLAGSQAGRPETAVTGPNRSIRTSLHPHVLIVDDSPDVRLSFRFMLEHDEFVVSEAESGSDALKRLARERFDVLLTDLYMPDITGLELIRSVRALPEPRPAIIAMSGEPNRAFQSALEAASSLGADATLTKPFSRADLVRTIRGIIGGGPALLSTPPRRTSKPPATGERRKRQRTVQEVRTTGLVELIVGDPAAAAQSLASDLEAGGDIAVVRSFLESAVGLAHLRGVDVQQTVERIKRDLRRMGHAV